MKTIFIFLLSVSSILFAQEYKCLYYAMDPLTDFKPTLDMDYLISFSIDSSRVTEVKITKLRDSIMNDSTELHNLKLLVERIEVKQLKYCFRHVPEKKEKFSVLFSGRTYIAYRREINYPKSLENDLKAEATEQGRVFINFGSVCYYDPKRH